MSRIYTSYYGNRHLPEHAFRVQVSGSRPRTYGVSATLPAALPDRDTMTAPLRDGSISREEYDRRYTAAIDENAEELLSQLLDIQKRAGDRPVVLLSYSGKDSPDSRRVLAGQLTRLTGEIIEELSASPG